MTVNPGFLDMVLAGLIAIGLPVISHILHLRSERLKRAGQAIATRTHYIHALFLLWVPASLLLMFWFTSGRPWSLIDLQATSGFEGMIGWIITAVVLVVLAVQVYLARVREGFARLVLNELEESDSVSELLPQSGSDLRLFGFVSFTAGVTEEIMFRGFLIWFFSFWMSLWAAAVLSLLSFVLAHLYQENAKSLVKVAVIGGSLTVLVLVSNSLWPAIVLHFFIDMVGGVIYWQARDNIARRQKHA